jgi:hypothetical protein
MVRYGTTQEVAEKLAVDTKCEHGAEARADFGLYAALKRRSSTVLHAFASFSATSQVVPFPHPFVTASYGRR